MANLVLPPIMELWYKYKVFAGRAITGSSEYKPRDMAYWQRRLFISLITYAMPLSLLAVVPSVIVAYNQGYLLIPVIDVLATLLIALVTFNKRIPIHTKKQFLVLVLYVVAVCLTFSLGSFGIGSIYLLALSVFITLQFTAKVAYRSVMVNCVIYAVFALIIHFKLFNSGLIGRYSVLLWIVYSLNFLFLNLAIIAQISHIINGVKTTFFQEARLLKKLRTEINEKAERNHVLRESEAHYKSLFLQNPSPMWIFDANTLQFLQVNDAAVKRYGYDKDEFMAMTIRDIRPEEKVDELAGFLQHKHSNNSVSVVTTQHQHKLGNVFYVEVRCSTIPYKGKEARLVITRNISAQIEYTQAIEKQNAKLREIAYMQSHVVRAPLARIMGLTGLVIQESPADADRQLLEYLEISVKELDDVIKSIINNSQEIFPKVTDREFLQDRVKHAG